jgi:hypothetical protein
LELDEKLVNLLTNFMKENSVVDAVANGDATAVNFAN